jgi:hypothetical protein
MKFVILKLTAFAMLATASGVYATDAEEPSTTTQSRRGSFLNEDGWGAGDWNGGDMSTCTSNCQCPGGESSDHHHHFSL